MSSSTDEILAARTAVNDAIARRDVAGIAAYLQPQYHVVTSRGEHRSGREASVKSWTELFAADPRATYLRTPEELHVNDELGVAQEHGRWSGTFTRDGAAAEIGGIYAAKWQRVEGGWRLEAELFTMLPPP